MRVHTMKHYIYDFVLHVIYQSISTITYMQDKNNNPRNVISYVSIR